MRRLPPLRRSPPATALEASNCLRGHDTRPPPPARDCRLDGTRRLALHDLHPLLLASLDASRVALEARPAASRPPHGHAASAPFVDAASSRRAAPAGRSRRGSAPRPSAP